MTRTTLLLLGFLVSFAAQAQIYQYKDASGRTVLTDQPPPSNIKKETLSSRVPAEPAAAGKASAEPKSMAERDLEFKKRQKEAQEASAKAEKEAADKAARQQDCAQAQRQLQMLESGERLATRDDKGERVYIDDKQRAAEIDRAKKFMSEVCR